MSPDSEGSPGTGFLGLMLAPVSAVMILVPWLWHMVLRTASDPQCGAWTPLDRTEERPPARARSLAARPARIRRPRKYAATAVLLLAVLALVPSVRNTAAGMWTGSEERQPFRLGAGVMGDSLEDLAGIDVPNSVPEDLDSREPVGDVEPAMSDSDWFTESNLYNTAQGWAFEATGAWQPINPYRLADFNSAEVNVENGTRRSWRAPMCDCRRLQVWMYGGSTTYGLNQRDEHTIASYLAKAAHDDGVTLDIENRGALGHLHWMEAERFAWDLTFQEPPDMVVFYDGVNDSWAGSTLNVLGTGDAKPMYDPTLIDMWRLTGRSDGPPPAGPPGSELIGRPEGELLELGDLERTVVERYNRSRALSATAAEAHGVMVRYLWQPTRFSRPLHRLEPHEDGRTENRSRASHQLTLDALPDDVISLDDALDGNQDPLFTDDVHHNELAARLIADALYAEIRDDLRSMT